jgi:branched-chain amino acid transport system substrate-binding protein
MRPPARENRRHDGKETTMTGSGLRFGLRRDGALDRRGFLTTAGRLGAGFFGASALGLPLLAAPARAAAEPFAVGWVRPTTGRLASSFAPLYVGGLIAIDEINAAGGILGRPILRQEEDDEGSPAKEPALVKKYQEGGIKVLCGPTGSSQTLASLAVTTPGKMVQATYANAAEVGDGAKYPYHYQCTFNTVQQGTVAVQYLVDALKVKKVGILQENTAFGEQATAASRAALEKAGLTPVDVQVYPLTAPDLNAYVANLRKAGAEGIVAWIANIPNLAMAFNAMASLKWFPPITGHNSLFQDAIFDLVPAEALQNVYGTHYRTLTFTESAAPGERQQKLAAKIRGVAEAKGLEVVVADSPYDDFLSVLKHVIEAEKSFEPEAIKRALDNLRGYPGILGTLNFSPTNHTGIALEDVALASVLSGMYPRAKGCFRERANGA